VSREAGHVDRDPRKIDAVFEAFVFKPEPRRWGSGETDGKAERLTE
jgi:hypothetical protein